MYLNTPSQDVNSTVNMNQDNTIMAANEAFTSSFGSADSLVFNTTYKIGLSSSQKDAISSNDTFSVPTIFSNYLAYDDGTAEAGYGIKNK